MKRIYATIPERVYRDTDSPEDAGEVVVLDWDSQTVLRRIVVDSGQQVPTGRSRGATGIDWYNEKIYVGCRAGLVALDPNTYEVLSSYSLQQLGLPGGLHQIKAHGPYLYLVCTGQDCLGVLHEDQVVQKVFLSNQKEDTLHFNSIGWDSRGHQYHLYMGSREPARKRRRSKLLSRIVNYSTAQEVHRELGKLPHDLCFLDSERLLYSVSAEGELVLLNLRTREKRVVLKNPIRSNPGIGQGYRVQGMVRGVAFDYETATVFVGVSPGTVYALDSDTLEEKSRFEFSRDLQDTIYDLLLDPRDWCYVGHCSIPIRYPEVIAPLEEIKLPPPIVQVKVGVWRKLFNLLRKP